MYSKLLRWLRNPIVIGPPECPILHRWPIVGGGTLGKPLIGSRNGFPFSIKVHRFLPNADDRDVHDHPWWFVTLVLRGSYNDMRTCPCERHAAAVGLTEEQRERSWCPLCLNTRVVLNERMTPGKIRFRPADHAHRTQVGPKGCWTVVVTGPKIERPWGFYRLGRKWTHKQYERRFGFGMRCD